MTTAIRTALVAALPALLLLVGCSAEPTIKTDRMAIERDAYGPTFEAAVQVLREHGWRIDRDDYRFGVITTLPRPSATWIEVWNSANTTAYQATESTINDQRRVVAVRMEKLDKPDMPEYLVRVEAIIERYQNPLHHLSGSTSGHRTLSTLRRVPAELRERGIAGPYWLPVGRDPYLERNLINAIAAAVKPPTEDEAAADSPADGDTTKD